MKTPVPEILRQRLVVEEFFPIVLDAILSGPSLQRWPTTYGWRSTGNLRTPRRFFSLLIYSCELFVEEEDVAHRSHFFQVEGELVHNDHFMDDKG